MFKCITLSYKDLIFPFKYKKKVFIAGNSFLLSEAGEKTETTTVNDMIEDVFGVENSILKQELLNTYASKVDDALEFHNALIADRVVDSVVGKRCSI